jgi:hypothetical protein
MKRGYVMAAVLVGVALSSSAAALAQEPPNADLAIISNAANVRHAKVGQAVTFTIVGKDVGPDVTDSFYVITGQAVQGFIAGPPLCDRFGDCGSTIICDRSESGGIPSADGSFCEFSDVRIGELYIGTISFRVLPTSTKFASDTACAASGDLRIDPNPANDCVTAFVRVVGKRN